MLSKLTAEQRSAVESDKKRIIVIAPPGTGKTNLVVGRFIYDTKKYGDDSVIAISFTRKAASEIGERLEKENIKTSPRFPSSGTFHSVALMILSLAAEKTLYSGPMTLATDETTELIISRLIAVLPKDDLLIQSRQRAVTKASRELTSALERVKRSGYTPIKKGYRFIDGSEHQLVQPLPNPSCAMHARMVSYQEELERQGLLDYNDALLVATRLMVNTDIRDIILPNLKTLIVDEYQDSNAINEMMVRALSQKINLLAACDDDQSIYYWRGAKPGLVNNFTRFWPGSEKIILTKNFRFPPAIRIIADNLMAPVQNRTPKTTEKERREEKTINDCVFVHKFKPIGPYDARSQGVNTLLGLYTADVVKDLIENKGALPQEIAVLARTHAAISNIAQGMNTREIPCRASNPNKTVSAELKHMMAWLDLLSGTNSIHAIATITRTPPQNRKLRDYFDYATSNNKSLTQYLQERLADGKIRDKNMSSAIKKLNEYIKLSDTKPMTEMLEKISEDILKDFELYMTEEREKIFWTAYNKLLPLASETAAGNFRPILNLLRNAISEDELVSPDSVTLSTIHHMKGRQAKYIVLCALADHIMPSTQSIATGEKSPESEEERRLVYVSYTRTQKELHLIGIEGCPSKFLDDTFMGLQHPENPELKKEKSPA